MGQIRRALSPPMLVLDSAGSIMPILGIPLCMGVNVTGSNDKLVKVLTDSLRDNGHLEVNNDLLPLNSMRLPISKGIEVTVFVGVKPLPK